MSNPPMPLRILKVRRTRKRIFIDYLCGDEERTVKSRDNPLPAFLLALDALASLVLAICHLPESYAADLKATGFTVTDRNMITVQATKSFEDAGSPLNIATPLRFLDLPEEEGTYSPALSEKQVALIDEAIEQAKQYVLGSRAQGQLSLDDDEEEADEQAAADNHAEDIAKGNQLPFAPDAGTSGKPAKKSKAAATS